MIFDEVDQGVGGAVADAVGQRLARLATGGQVLVVTHSPQVAARANAHWRVSRHGAAERTEVEALAGARVRLRTKRPAKDRRELEQRLDQLRREKDQAVAAEDYDRARSLRDEIAELTDRVDSAPGGPGDEIAQKNVPEVGPAGLTYSLLAERAGGTRQTLYRHWPARPALLLGLILEGVDGDYPEPGTDPGAVAAAWLASLRDGLRDRGRRIDRRSWVSVTVYVPLKV